MKTMYRAKQKESEEMIRKLEKKGERSKDCRVNWMGVYTSVSEHSEEKAPKKYNFTRDFAGVEWRSPAVPPRLKFRHIMC